MGFMQYIKDTKGELRYVAWPTRLQTIVYTILVIIISIFVALYLGLFDFIFTTGLRNTLEVLPQGSPPGRQPVPPFLLGEVQDDRPRHLGDRGVPDPRREAT